MAGNSKACFTVISYEENLKFFDTTVQKEIEFWQSQKVSGIAVGLHHKEVDDKNHEHWMMGYSKSAPSLTDFINTIKARNAELQEAAKAAGKDISIVLESGEVVDRALYKIYSGRYAKKHCVYDPEALEDYLSHSTAAAKKDNKVQYDPDKDVIYSDGFDLDSYLSRDAIAKAKADKRVDDVTMMVEIYRIIRKNYFTNILDLVEYLADEGRTDLLAYCHAHSATVHFATSDLRHDCPNFSRESINGTNSEDEKPYRPEPEPVKKTYSESQEILRRSTDEVFGVQSSDEASEPSQGTHTHTEPSVETTPASAEETPASDEAGLSGISTATSGDASLPVDSSGSGIFTQHEMLMLDPSVRASLTRALTEDDFEEIDSDGLAGLFD